MATLTEESPTVGRQVLTLAGDTLRSLAATALRLTLLPPKDSLSLKEPRLLEVSLAEVLEHDHSADCWIVVYDLVYDVTKFLNEHPGGADVVLEYAGRDASIAFKSVNHGPAAMKALDDCLIGRLPENERIFGPA